MPKEKSPAFQFYVRNVLASPTIRKMTGDQAKAYYYLLCYAWLESPRASLPNDDNDLASYAGVSVDVWNKIKPGIMKAFYMKENRWYNEFLETVSDRQYVNSKKGKVGGEKAKGTSGRKRVVPRQGLQFPPEPRKKRERPVITKQLFSESSAFILTDFEKVLKPEFPTADLSYYHARVKAWAGTEMKRKDYFASARTFILNDIRDKRLKTMNGIIVQPKLKTDLNLKLHHR